MRFREESFQSTPSAWRETTKRFQSSTRCSVFQSTPSAWRETICCQLISTVNSQFQSTPSAWRETTSPRDIRNGKPYFNPLPPHGGRLIISVRFDGSISISIHSLRMEGDDAMDSEMLTYIHFNPLPPHGGRLNTNKDVWQGGHFNPLPPHGGRLYKLLN